MWIFVVEHKHLIEKTRRARKLKICIRTGVLFDRDNSLFVFDSKFCDLDVIR